VVARVVELSDGLTRRSIDLPIQGDGSETRSFCYIDDGARGALVAGERGTPGEIYHVGIEQETSIRDLVEMTGEAIGVRVTIVPGPRRHGGAVRRCPDTTKLRALGYTPTVDLQAGLERTARWYADRYRTQGANT
ncbi:MAG TPA: NAD-dependent epimerase/dehydratase family protein, partial [Aquihabitans sp.]|nr:NAD-dependent epimerase/dehydratase family protein [Aquihabitans sp.]